MAYDFDFSTAINVGTGRPRGLDMGTLFDPSGPYGGQSFNSTVSDEATLEPGTSQTGDTADIDRGTQQFQDLLNVIYGEQGQNYLKAKSRIMLDQQKEHYRSPPGCLPHDTGRTRCCYKFAGGYLPQRLR